MHPSHRRSYFGQIFQSLFYLTISYTLKQTLAEPSQVMEKEDTFEQLCSTQLLTTTVKFQDLPNEAILTRPSNELISQAILHTNDYLSNYVKKIVKNLKKKGKMKILLNQHITIKLLQKDICLK